MISLEINSIIFCNNMVIRLSLVNCFILLLLLLFYLIIILPHYCLLFFNYFILILVFSKAKVLYVFQSCFLIASLQKTLFTDLCLFKSNNDRAKKYFIKKSHLKNHIDSKRDGLLNVARLNSQNININFYLAFLIQWRSCFLLGFFYIVETLPCLFNRGLSSLYDKDSKG